MSAPRDKARGSRLREALLVLAVGLAVFAWPVRAALFDGSRVLCGVDTATCQLPWSQPGPRNAELADQGAFFYPTWRFVAERWRRGEAPLWNADIYAGVPCVGNPQAGVLDPQTLALAALDALGGRALFDRGFALGAWLRLALAACGAFALARALGLARAGASLAAASFAGSAFLSLWLGSSLGHVAWLAPWVLLALERVRTERAPAAVLAAAVVFALALYAGHPETAFYIGAAGGVWALAMLREDLAAGARALGALAFGTLLGAPVLLPFVEYLQRSGALVARSAVDLGSVDWLALGVATIVLGVVLRARELAPEGDADARAAQRFAAGFALVVAAMFVAVAYVAPWPLSARLALLPDLFGSAGVDPRGWFGAGSYLEQASAWLPSTTLALALAALVSRPAVRLRGAHVLAALGLAAFVLALRAPGVLDLYRRVPGVGLGATVRAAPVAALAFALLAGAAFESAPRYARWAAASALSLALGVLVLTARSAAPDERLAVELDPPDGLVELVHAPAAELSSGLAQLEGWIHPGLPIESAAVRVEPLDSGLAVAHELPLPLELSTQPSRAEDAARAPAGARWFRAPFLEVRQLAEGAWRFVVELRGADGRVLGERVVAASLVRRAPNVDRRSLALIFAGLAAAALLRPRASRWGGWSTLLACALVLAASFWFLRGANPAVPREACFAPTRTTEILARELGARRFLADAGVLPASTALAHGLRSLDGYDALDVATFNSFRPFALKSGVHPLLGWTASGVDLDSPALRLLGVGALVRTGPLEHPDWELVAGPLDGAPERAECWIYRSKRPQPRAFCVGEVVEIDSVLAAPGEFDFQRTAFLERGATWSASQRFTRAEVSEPEMSTNEVRVRASLDGDALLVLTEQFFPGWSATVDGRAADVLCVDGIFRGVALGAGEHEVVFRYRPAALTLGLGLALLALALFGAWSWRRRG